MIKIKKMKDTYEETIFKQEFKKWLYERMNYVSNSFGFASVVKIVRQFYKENSEKQFEGMRKDTAMWVEREKMLEAKIKKLEDELKAITEKAFSDGQNSIATLLRK